MKWSLWPLLAMLAGLAACAEDSALYRSDKYVPGYRPRGDSGPAVAWAVSPLSSPGEELRRR